VQCGLEPDRSRATFRDSVTDMRLNHPHLSVLRLRKCEQFMAVWHAVLCRTHRDPCAAPSPMLGVPRNPALLYPALFYKVTIRMELFGTRRLDRPPD
jgi:hypothetical protein